MYESYIILTLTRVAVVHCTEKLYKLSIFLCFYFRGMLFASVAMVDYQLIIACSIQFSFEFKSLYIHSFYTKPNSIPFKTMRR